MLDHIINIYYHQIEMLKEKRA